jgi:hypothetical protein
MPDPDVDISALPDPLAAPAPFPTLQTPDPAALSQQLGTQFGQPGPGKPVQTFQPGQPNVEEQMFTQQRAQTPVADAATAAADAGLPTGKAPGLMPIPLADGQAPAGVNQELFTSMLSQDRDAALKAIASLDSDEKDALRKKTAIYNDLINQQKAFGREEDAIAQKIADLKVSAVKDEMTQDQKLDQWVQNTPTRQAIYATGMHMMAPLSILAAIGGAVTKNNAMTMLAANAGIVEGINSGSEAKYNEALDRWKIGYQRMQDHAKNTEKMFNQMIDAYQGLGNARERAAARTRMILGDQLDAAQLKVGTDVQLLDSTLKAAKITESYAAALDRVENQRLQKSLMTSPGGLAAMGWTPEIIDSYAERGLRGDYTWRVGLSRSAGGSAIIAAIDRRAAEMSYQRGIPAGEFATIPATAKGLSHALQERQSYLEAVKPAVGQFNNQAAIIRRLLKPGVGGDSPVWNKYQQYVRGEVAGDDDVMALDLALQGAGREHRRIITGPRSNATLTDDANKRADAVMNINLNARQILRNLRVMEDEGQGFYKANQQEVVDIRRQISNLGAGPQLDKPPVSASPGASWERPPTQVGDPGAQGKTVTGTATEKGTGRKVLQYSDGSLGYEDQQ